LVNPIQMARFTPAVSWITILEAAAQSLAYPRPNPNRCAAERPDTVASGVAARLGKKQRNPRRKLESLTPLQLQRHA